MSPCLFQLSCPAQGTASYAWRPARPCCPQRQKNPVDTGFFVGATGLTILDLPSPIRSTAGRTGNHILLSIHNNRLIEFAAGRSVPGDVGTRGGNRARIAGTLVIPSL